MTSHFMLGEIWTIQMHACDACAIGRGPRAPDVDAGVDAGAIEPMPGADGGGIGEGDAGIPDLGGVDAPDTSGVGL